MPFRKTGEGLFAGDRARWGNTSGLREHPHEVFLPASAKLHVSSSIPSHSARIKNLPSSPKSLDCLTTQVESGNQRGLCLGRLPAFRRMRIRNGCPCDSSSVNRTDGTHERWITGPRFKGRAFGPRNLAALFSSWDGAARDRRNSRFEECSEVTFEVQSVEWTAELETRGGSV